MTEQSKYIFDSEVYPKLTAMNLERFRQVSDSEAGL